MIRKASICILYQIAHSTEEAKKKKGARELCRVSLSFATGVTFTQDFSLDLLVE